MTRGSCRSQLAESTQQLLLRMADYTRQTVELTRQELQVVIVTQVSSRRLQPLLSRPSCGLLLPVRRHASLTLRRYRTCSNSDRQAALRGPAPRGADPLSENAPQSRPALTTTVRVGSRGCWRSRA